MKYTERLLFRKSALIKPIACLALAVSALSIAQIASATIVSGMGNNRVWCNGDGTPYAEIPGFPNDTKPAGRFDNPADTWDEWDDKNPLFNGMPLTYLTNAPAAPNANDRYVVQLNYWNSIVGGKPDTVGYAKSDAPFGHSAGHSCVTFMDQTSSTAGNAWFNITYPATPSKPDQREIDFRLSNPNDYPLFVPFADGPTSGGPTGYISTYKGCSWDGGSCTPGSEIPAPGKTITKSADTNVFPEKLSDVTSIPTQWTIEFNKNYGNPGEKDKTKQVWDASYDIWFDKTGHLDEGIAPYGNVRGQPDGLEIMVWMNSNGSYVDAGTVGTIPTEGQAGLAQPTGHIRERVVINNILYDVWVGRLNNPYFGYVGGAVVKPNDIPGNCATSKGKGAAGVLCGVEWNVVSFVATKDLNGTDYRKNSMSLDAKVFSNYILGIDDGLWKVYGAPVVGSPRTANQVLKCPASNKDQSLSAATADCLSSSWYLMSVQAGFEPWIGGNGLSSDSFSAHVITKSTGIQTGLMSEDGKPIIHWASPFDVVYSGCSAYSSSNKVEFYIEGTDILTGGKRTYPLNGTKIDMGKQDPTTLQFTSLVTEALYPMHDKATIHFTSSSPGCAAENVDVFIDPSGRVFYSDGKTPIQGAKVTLSYSTSGAEAGPFSVVPDHNKGLAKPIMQPNDNTQNPMLSTALGSYAWNTIAGWYKVNASFDGCGSVTTIAKQVTVGHPVENLNINLPCAAPAPLPAPPSPVTPGVTVKLTLNGVDTLHSYCRNIVVKNTTAKPVKWVVNFNLPFVGDVTQTWNLTYTKAGNSMRASGSADWNYTLQPGQTLSSSGFCATK